MSGGFCGACGAAQPSPPTRFCSHCGNPIGAVPPAPSAPPASYAPPEVLGFGAPVGDRGPRRRWPLVVAGVVVLVLVGAVVVAATVLRGGSDTTADGTVLPAAVTSQPEEAWRYDSGDDYVGPVTGVGDRVLVVDEDGEVVALGADGEEEWTYDDEYVGYLTTVGDRDDVVLVTGGEAGGFGALSSEDGEELWWDDSGYVTSGAGEVLLAADIAEGESTGDLRRLDVSTGDEEWVADGLGSITAIDDAVYAVRTDELSRLDLGSGEVEWTADLDLDEDQYAQVVGTGDIVTVAVDQEVTAFDASGGDELWTWTADDSDASVYLGIYAEGRVYVEESVYDEDDSSSRTDVTVRDRDGDVGDFSVEGEDYVDGVAVESGGTSWFLNRGSGELYDDEVARVASYDGSLTVADRGVYGAESDSVAFYDYGESRSSWELDLPDEEDRSIYAVDGALLVVADGTLTAYR